MPPVTLPAMLLPAKLWNAPLMNKPVNIPVPEARGLAGLLSLPASATPWPAIVVASGSSYPKEGAIVAAMTGQALAAGWAVLTFDWSYTTYGGSPSSSRKREKRELQAALDYLLNIDGSDARRTVVAGKSLGSAVAYALFLDNLDLLGAALLTPVMRTPEGAEKAYPGLTAQARPIHLLTGKSDPLNALPVMEAHLAGAGKQIVTTLIDGDHGLNVTRKKDEASQARNRANVAAGVRVVVRWLETLSAP